MIDKQYTELREALVGDSPNWTHEELIEKVLEIYDEVKRLRKVIVGYGHSIQLTKEDMKEAKKEMIE